jgi:hypothetical protein
MKEQFTCFAAPIIALAILTTAAQAQGTPNVITKFGATGSPNANSIMFDDGTNVGISTTNPTQRLTLGSGNVFLPNPRAGLDGNLYFGGTTDTGQVGMRLFGGNIGGVFQSGFIDVRAGTLTDGLRFRVDTFFAGAERMRINALGNVGIGTENPVERLDVAGTIRSSSGGFIFPDGTRQTTATQRGPQGQQGPQGPAGPEGPPTHTVAVCQSGGIGFCSCNNKTVTSVIGVCTVTADTGGCNNPNVDGCCAVCVP